MSRIKRAWRQAEEVLAKMARLDPRRREQEEAVRKLKKSARRGRREKCPGSALRTARHQCGELAGDRRLRLVGS